MKSLRAKFKVGSVTNFGNNNFEANMTPVVSGSEENKDFSLYTPSGAIRLHVTNPAASGFFEAGEDVYVVFVKKESPSEDGDVVEMALNNIK